ncbi:hypothetical protein HOD20_06320 [archaeon]|jgi:hypothetical protein|nr:hypothetical protein [archaeon]MBT4352117.1 hypothetical protein [archaeon]MBT4648434.1 hypothetical protein [archaeon]MBT6821758.1 hypothetical protein [archaeon]MBT7391212.1 hypothetical protein [archaeon]
MAKKKKDFSTKFGPLAFTIGLILAAITGIIITPTVGMLWLLGALGLIVGLLNISDKEVKTYLISSMAFLISTSSLSMVLGPVPLIGQKVTPFLTNIVIFLSPGTAIVALKALYSLTKD